MKKKTQRIVFQDRIATFPPNPYTKSVDSKPKVIVVDAGRQVADGDRVLLKYGTDDEASYLFATLKVETETSVAMLIVPRQCVLACEFEDGSYDGVIGPVVNVYSELQAWKGDVFK